MANNIVRINYRQREILLGYMEDHPELVSGELNGAALSKTLLNNLWEEINSRLNSEGSRGVKDVEKWKRCWLSWKSQVKRKSAQGKMKPVGGGNGDDSALTPLEIRLAAVIARKLNETNSRINVAGVPGNLDVDTEVNAEIGITKAETEPVINNALPKSPGAKTLKPTDNKILPRTPTSIKTIMNTSKDANEIDVGANYDNIEFRNASELEPTITDGPAIGVDDQPVSIAERIRKRKNHTSESFASKRIPSAVHELSHFERAAKALKEMKGCKVEALQYIEKALTKAAFIKENIATEEKKMRKAVLELTSINF